MSSIVARLPIADAHRLVNEFIRGLQTGLQPGEIDERFERGSRLALRLSRAVELAFAVIAAANHRADRAVRRHCYEGALGYRHFGSITHENFGDGCFGLDLHARV